MSLREILQDAVQPVGAGGIIFGDLGPGDNGAMKELDRRLGQLRRSLEVYFAICIGMIVALFVVELIVIITRFDQPQLVKATIAACGVSTIGLVLLVARLWRERDRTSTIIILAQSLEPADLRAVLYALLEKQFGKRTHTAGSTNTPTTAP